MRRKRDLPRGWGLPLGAAILALLGGGDAAAKLLVAYCGMSIAALALPDALRQGCSELISKRKVLGSALISAALTVLLSAAALLALGFKFNTLPSETFAWIIVAALALVLRVASETFAAGDRSLPAQIAEVLTAALPVVWMQVFAGDAAVLLYAAGGLGVIALAPAAAALKGRPQADFRFMKHIPSALVRATLFPAMAITLILSRAFYGRMTSNSWEIAAVGAGILVIELTKSTFRRDRSESEPVLAAVTAFAAAAALAGACALLLPAGDVRTALENAPWMLVLSAGCALELFASGGLRAVAAIVLLMLSPFVPTLWPFIPAVKAALVFAAALLMIPEWQSIFRGVRAGSIRRRAQR